jgi:hypothetical protein
MMASETFTVTAVKVYGRMVLVTTSAPKGTSTHSFFAPNWDIWQPSALIRRTCKKVEAETGEKHCLYTQHGQDLYQIKVEKLG